jgi:hypothetical protein
VWLLAFSDEPLAGLDRDVGGAACQTAPFFFVNASKQWNLLEISGSNHNVSFGLLQSFTTACKQPRLRGKLV